MCAQEEANNIPSESTEIDSLAQLKHPISSKDKFTWPVVIMLIVIVLAWATPNVIGRYLSVNSELTPLQISSLRYLPAAFTLLIFSLITRRGKQLLIDMKEKYYHLIIAALILASFVILQMYSVQGTTASVSSFLLNVNPVITFLLATIILKERHRWWGFIGVLISLGGVFLIAIPLDEISYLFSSETFWSNVLAFGSGLAWAVYSIYLKKFLHNRDPITTTTWTLSISAIILTILALAVDRWFSSPPAYYHIILTTFMGIVPTAIAFTLWFAVINRIDVQKASVFQFLIPIIATCFSLFMGETIDYLFGIGAALILGGLVITQFS